MLTAVYIEKYLSCENVSITDMSHFMALVGRNGAGKTNVLKAIEWAAETATGEQGNGSSGDDAKIVTLEFKINDTLFKYAVTLSIQYRQSNEGSVTMLGTFEEIFKKRSKSDSDWTELVQRENGIINHVGAGSPFLTNRLTPCLQTLTKILPANDTLAMDIATASAFLKGIHYYPLEEPHYDRGVLKYISHNDYVDWVNDYNGTGGYKDSTQAKLLYLNLNKKDSFEALQMLLGASGLDIIDQIRIDEVKAPSLELEKDDILYYLRFKPSKLRPSWLGLTQLSLGTRRVLRILATLFFDDSSVFLFEQPEDAIHDQLLRKVANIIRMHSDPAQFIVASHSSMVLCEFKPEQIRIVEIKDGATAVRALTPNEVSVANRYVKETGALSDFIESIEEN